MTEEPKQKLYSVKISGTVNFVGGSSEKFENIDVIRETESSMVLLKEKMPDIDLFRVSIQYPLRNIKSMKTVITEAIEIE